MKFQRYELRIYAKSWLTIVDNFYEAACFQAPFPFYLSVTPSVVHRAGCFLKCEACICLERTSRRAWPQAIGEELEGSEGETILTEVVSDYPFQKLTNSGWNIVIDAFSIAVEAIRQVILRQFWCPPIVEYQASKCSDETTICGGGQNLSKSCDHLPLSHILNIFICL